MQIRIRSVALAAASLAFAGLSAHASEVSIYGVADVYVAYQKGDDSETKIDSGGLSGSRLGFSASRDIGNGLKAMGRIEAGVALDSGNNNQGRIWGRQTWVGLSGGFGTITLGRQYTPNFIALDSDDPFETGAGSAVSSGIVSIVGGPRKDSSLVYELPKMGPVTVNLMYAAGEQAGDQSLGSFFASSARYADGPLGLGLSVAQQSESVEGNVSTSSVLLSGSYDFGALKLMGGVQVVRNSTGAPNVDDNRDEAYVGVQVPVGNGSLWAAVGTGRTKNLADSRASQASLGYLYKLDRSTTIYGVLTGINNGAVTAFTTDTATGGGAAVSPGERASALQVGVRFRF